MTKFHWAGFGSGSGTNLEALAEVKPPAVIVCDRPNAGLLEKKSLSGIPKIVLDGVKECGSWQKAKGDPEKEEEYRARSLLFNKKILLKLREFEKKWDITLDGLFLGGYMRLVMDPLLRAFPDAIYNVHPAPLAELDAQGRRKFVGTGAVYDTLKAYYEEDRPLVTRSSVILVDNGIDAGEILISGPWATYEGPLPPTQESCDKFQKKLKKKSDHPAFKKALEGIIQGVFSFSEKRHPDGKRIVLYQGKELAYQGITMLGDR